MSMLGMLAVCILLGATGAQGANGAAEDILRAPRWELAPEISFFKYEEPGLMTNEGVLYGVAGAYTRYHDNRLFRIEGEFALAPWITRVHS
jgi:hypothetical protein